MHVMKNIKNTHLIGNMENLKKHNDLEGLKIFYEDGKIWHYRPIDENTIEWC